MAAPSPFAPARRRGRWLQYRAVLTTPNGGSTPYLEEVSVSARG